MYSDKQIPQSLVALKNNDNEEIILPLEVISYIMEFLPYSDRIVAGQVCQMWYQASINQKFLNQEKVVFNRMLLEDDSTVALNIISRSYRSFLHFVFIESELSFKMQKFWIKVGPEIKSLSMRNCDLTERMLVEILTNCTSLESLDINNCREPLISGRLLDDEADINRLRKSLINVTKLNLCNNRYLSDSLFNRFVSTMVNLNTICLAGCQISFHPGLYKKFYPNKLISANSTYASETVLTFLNIMQFIQQNSEKLMALDFSHTLVNSKSLSLIAELPKLHLKELYLQNCEQLTNASILVVSQYQCSLAVLDLSGCSRVTDQSLISICCKLVHLEKLSVCNCRAITDLGVVELKKLQKLKYIDLSQCEQVTGDGLESAFCLKSGNRLKWLYLRALNNLPVKTIVSITESVKNLLRLDLSYCFNAVTDQSVQAIFKNLILLHSLKLANCDSITDAGLTGIAEENIDRTLKSSLGKDLDAPVERNYISLRSKAEEDIVRDARRKETVKLMCSNFILSDKESYSLSSLKGLQELDLQSCNRITDVSLEYALRLNELQHLNLSRCQQVTDTGLTFVAINNPSIDTLNLSHCHNISDDGIKALVKSLHRLRYIDIQGCKQLTDASLMAIKTNCPSLRYLDITHCKMSPDTVDMAPLAALQTLHVSPMVY